MALRVWLPLNGDLINQGLSNVNITNNGATIDNNGKIGKCYSFGSSKRIAISQPDNLSTSSASLSCWVNLSSWGSSYDSLVNLSTGTGWNDTRLALVRNNTANRIGFCIANGSTYNYVVMKSDLPLNTWTHLAGTFDGSTIKIYVNGILNNSLSTTFSSLVYGSAILNLGSWSNGNNYPINGKLNDIRLYDHCLSPKEIKEISKGLCLHYKLAGPGRPNLLSYQKLVKQSNVSFSYDPNTLTFTTKTPTTATCYGVMMSTNNCIIPWNHVGIMSMDILSPVATTFYRDDNDYAVSGNSWSGNDNTSRGSVITAIPANKWTKVIIYSINNKSLNTNHESVKVQSSFNINTADVEFKFKNVKFEVSPISTDRNVTLWCPASDDTLYAALGYNNNIEDDCSGYCRNGVKSGTITWDSDSPRYATSYKFGSTSTKIKATNFGMSGFANSYSFAWWQKNTGSGNMPWGFSDGNRLNLYHTTNLCWNTGDGSNNPFKDSSGTAIPNTKLCDSKWHHCVVTGNGSITKLYIDGNYVGNATTYKPITGTQIYISGWDATTSYTFSGSNISDFRIYATALSDADILELYEVGGIIDSNYNSYAYEFIEE